MQIYVSTCHQNKNGILKKIFVRTKNCNFNTDKDEDDDSENRDTGPGDNNDEDDDNGEIHKTRTMAKEDDGYNNKREDYMIRKEDMTYFR